MTISTEAGRLPVLVATFFGAGFSPVAPGTVGSLAALPLALPFCIWRSSQRP